MQWGSPGGLPHGQERFFSLDALRGFAIMGIFFANMPAFLFPVLYNDRKKFIENNFDRWVYGAIDVVAEASFYPLFAFLFGYGLVIMKERLEYNGRSFVKIALRRMLVLLGIGMIHAFLIWSGDILIIYACFGFLLIPIIQTNVKAKTLAILALLMYTIPGIILIMLYRFLLRSGILTEADLYDPALTEAALAIYQGGSFLEITRFRILEWVDTNVNGLVLLLFMVFPFLLFGVSSARAGMLIPDGKYRHFFRNLFIITMPFGLFVKMLPYLFSETITNELLQDLFGGPLLTCAYISAGYLLANSPLIRKVMAPFQKVGRLSLSNYLSQSIIATSICYSYGLGLYGKLSYTIGAMLVFFIFIFQLVVSNYWLQYFRMGPGEWLWRWGTYGKKPQLKIKKELLES